MLRTRPVCGLSLESTTTWGLSLKKRSKVAISGVDQEPAVPGRVVDLRHPGALAEGAVPLEDHVGAVEGVHGYLGVKAGDGVGGKPFRGGPGTRRTGGVEDVREAVLSVTPSYPFQTTWAWPSGSTATWGSVLPVIPGESMSGSTRTPRCRWCTRCGRAVPSLPDQTTWTLLSESRASCGRLVVGGGAGDGLRDGPAPAGADGIIDVLVFLSPGRTRPRPRGPGPRRPSLSGGSRCRKSSWR